MAEKPMKNSRADTEHYVRQLGGPMAENRRGQWVQSVPLPFYGRVRKTCMHCGRKFWTEDGYRGHYAYAHILGMEGPDGS